MKLWPLHTPPTHHMALQQITDYQDCQKIDQQTVFMYDIAWFYKPLINSTS